MDGTGRGTRRGRAVLIAALLAGAMALAGAAVAEATAVLERLGLSGPAVVGKDVDLQAEATDLTAPVSGMVVRFGASREVFGTSACRPPDSSGLPPARPFAPGSKVRLTAPHRFRRKGARKVLVRLDSGGCLLPLTSSFSQMMVAPSDPGEPTRSPGRLEPALPAPVGSLPTLLPRLSRPPLRGASGGTGGAQASARIAARRPCAGARRRIGRSARSRRAGRRALLCLLNRHRRAHRLPAMRANARLQRAAEGHSRSMVRLGFFSHVGPGGLGILDRVLRSGYLRRVAGWSIGENIGFGYGPGSSPSAMMHSWMRSTPHRANILTGRFREVGLGIASGVPGNRRARGATFTTDFGVRR